jgi:hypothetical protein
VSHLPDNFRKCRKLLTSVENIIQAYFHNDDTKEALKTSHVLGLKKENWLTEVKEILTPEKSSETMVLRVSAPLYQP